MCYYKGPTRVKRGDQVNLVTIDGDVYATTKVVDALAMQFTCKVRGKTRFFFYEDKGVTWQLGQSTK
jgi:hypothetical protein